MKLFLSPSPYVSRTVNTRSDKPRPATDGCLPARKASNMNCGVCQRQTACASTTSSCQSQRRTPIICALTLAPQNLRTHSIAHLWKAGSRLPPSGEWVAVTYEKFGVDGAIRARTALGVEMSVLPPGGLLP
eukprot:scaffold97737_cov57-Phaeocystis_antarctica.AAC.1